MRFRLPILAVLALLATTVAASTWSVQRDGTGDFTTVQPALDAAADGDTILIGPGEYTESTTVRLPGWAYDIRSYAHLRCDNLTIIGFLTSTQIRVSRFFGAGPRSRMPALLCQWGQRLFARYEIPIFVLRSRRLLSAILPSEGALL
jgi:hypothetical protein